MGWFLCYLVTLLLSHFLSLCTCQDKIVPKQYITGNQTLVSSLGTFALGFFSPENSTKYFLGIQFNTFPDTALVWIANRESPLDAPGFFMLSSDGILVVLEETRNLVWSTNASLSASAMNHTTGLLADTGNLVLSFEEVTLWQSFDQPSDTLLPGMKISLNKKTGQQRRLTSWAGLMIHNLESSQSAVILKYQFRSLSGRKIFRTLEVLCTLARIQEQRSKIQVEPRFSCLTTNNYDIDEVYIVYSVSDSSARLLSPTGQYKQLLWLDSSKTWLELLESSRPVDNCDFYARCGPNSVCHRGESLSSLPCKRLTGFTVKFPNQSALGDWSSGCVRENDKMYLH